MKRLCAVLLLSCWCAQAPAANTKKTCPKTLKGCPEEGCRGDPRLNVVKNSTKTATRPEDIGLNEIVNLNSESPRRWKPGSNRLQLAKLGEGKPVTVEGYLINAHVTKSPEACNCFLTGPDNNDYHLNLVPNAGDPMKESVVVELSPRSRKPGWEIGKVKKAAKEKKFVRVTGFLLFDSHHASFGHMPRASAWEVHPVTKFEVCSSGTCSQGGWTPLEKLAR